MTRARSLLLVAVLVAGALAMPIAGHAAPAHAATGLEGVPAYDHVFTIVLENENFASTWNTPAPGGGQTYLQTLRSTGAFADEYFGISHVSADNYIAMTSGQPATPLFNLDCMVSWGLCETFEKVLPDGGRSIADQVDEAHKSWKAYMDGMQTPCQHPPLTALTDPYQNGYATRHDPFVYYPPVVENAARCNSHVVPYSDLAADLVNKSTTPAYAFIVPDTCHDGHDSPCVAPDSGPGGLDSANAWLQTEVQNILHSDAFLTQNSLLLITFDENGISDIPGCCGALADVNQLVAGGAPTVSGVAAIGGRIGLLAIGPGVKAGQTISTPYDHWSYLRTVEDALGISEHLNLAGLPITQPMTDLFN